VIADADLVVGAPTDVLAIRTAEVGDAPAIAAIGGVAFPAAHDSIIVPEAVAWAGSRPTQSASRPRTTPQRESHFNGMGESLPRGVGRVASTRTKASRVAVCASCGLYRTGRRGKYRCSALGAALAFAPLSAFTGPKEVDACAGSRFVHCWLVDGRGARRPPLADVSDLSRIRTLRHGDWVMFLVGIALSIFRLVGALRPRRS
jgi:hypothetical protein